MSVRRTMQNLSALEKQVLSAMARADREREGMEQQIEAARVTAREYTNVGFFTELSTPEHIATLDLGRRKLEDMPHGFADHPSLSAGAGFILWIKDGRLVSLEGFTSEGTWPTDEARFRVAV